MWQQAIKEELTALANNHTWNIITLPVGKQAVGCHWIFKTKFNSNGIIK
jgi:histone deacetylase 1/2